MVRIVKVDKFGRTPDFYKKAKQEREARQKDSRERAKAKSTGSSVGRFDKFGVSKEERATEQANIKLRQFQSQEKRLLQNAVNKGQVTVKRANKLFNQSINKRVTDLNNQLQSEFTRLQRSQMPTDNGLSLKRRIELDAAKARAEKSGIGSRIGRALTDKKRAFKPLNFISGGALQNASINRREKDLINQIKQFNIKYSNRKLTPAQFRRATLEKGSIDKQMNKISSDRDALRKSGVGKFGEFLTGKKGTLGTPTKEQNRVIKQKEIEIKAIETKLKNEKNFLKKQFLKGEVGKAKRNLDFIKRGQVPLIMGSPPPYYSSRFFIT